MPDAQHRPVILISGSAPDSSSVGAIMAMVRAQGAEPMLITNHAGRLQGKDDHAFIADVEATLAKADGVIVMGNNNDIDPYDYNSPFKHPKTKSEADTPEGVARGKYEYVLLTKALEKKVPLLGVCGGMQRLNVLLGGSLNQHVPDLVGNEMHDQSAAHIPGYVPVEFIKVEEGTSLHRIADGVPGMYVPSSDKPIPGIAMENSFHHQSVDKVGKGLRVSAVSIEPDKPDVRIVEAIEADPQGKFGGQFVMGVQWHPEFGASDLSANLIKHLAEQARGYSKIRSSEQAMQETARSLNAPQQAWVQRLRRQQAALATGFSR